MNAKSRHNTIEKRIKENGSVCCWCCKHLKREDITLEHLIPKSLGGSNAFENLYLACRHCNQSRGNHLLPPKYSVKSLGYQKLLEWLLNAYAISNQKNNVQLARIKIVCTNNSFKSATK